MTSDQMTRLQEGQTVLDSTGQKIGDIARVFYDQSTSEPAWITVRGGRFGGREAFVPMAGSQLGPSGLAVAVRKDMIQDAPAIDAGSELSADDAARLNRYYEGMLSAAAPARMPAQGQAPPRPQPEPQPRPTEAKPVELTTHEEQIRVNTQPVDAGTVRLHKYVVTEPVETSVPIRREEVSVERVPAASSTPDPGHRFEEQAVEVTLHEERPTIAKETIPTETVRLATKTQTEQQRVSDQVRRERIDVEDQRLGAGNTAAGNQPGGELPGGTRRR